MRIALQVLIGKQRVDGVARDVWLLAPSSCSSPRPSEWRRSISAASRGWLVTIAFPRSFSHHLKAGMSSLSPCRRPAWQAPVCDDQSVSQRSSR